MKVGSAASSSLLALSNSARIPSVITRRIYSVFALLYIHARAHQEGAGRCRVTWSLQQPRMAVG